MIEDYKVRFDDITFDCVDFGYKPNEQIKLALDVAASELYDGKVYKLEGKEFTSERENGIILHIKTVL